MNESSSDFLIFTNHMFSYWIKRIYFTLEKIQTNSSKQMVAIKIQKNENMMRVLLLCNSLCGNCFSDPVVLGRKSRRLSNLILVAQILPYYMGDILWIGTEAGMITAKSKTSSEFLPWLWLQTFTSWRLWLFRDIFHWFWFSAVNNAGM